MKLLGLLRRRRLGDSAQTRLERLKKNRQQLRVGLAAAVREGWQARCREQDRLLLWSHQHQSERLQ
jgi:hypothetical protein